MEGVRREPTSRVGHPDPETVTSVPSRGSEYLSHASPSPAPVQTEPKVPVGKLEPLKCTYVKDLVSICVSKI